VALNDAEEIRRHLEHDVDLVIDAGACDGQVTTVIDLSADAPRLVREGKGDVRPFGSSRKRCTDGDLHNTMITILVYALPVIFAITLHEAAHGYVAKHFGDSTAYMLGRVTLNPIKHIDSSGTIVLPIATRRSRVHVRLGQAGAGELQQPALAEARQPLGRVRRDRVQHVAGRDLGARRQDPARDGVATGLVGAVLGRRSPKPGSA
jgi:hypothetical protein